MDEGFARGAIRIEAAGNLNLKRIGSLNGSVSATSANGNIQLLPLGFIDARGAVAMTTFSSNGIISFAPGTQVHSSLGSIVVQIGTGVLGESEVLAGTINNIAYQPSGGKINIPIADTGGQDRILGQQINVVRAERSSISLRPGSAGQIELNGGVRISIDDDTEIPTPPPPRPPVIPISFSSRNAIRDDLYRAITSCATIWTKANASVSYGKKLLQVTKGESIIQAQTDAEMLIGNIRVKLDKHSILQVLASDDAVIIRCLFDEHSGSVKIQTGKDKILLYPGQELIFGSENRSSTAYRNRRTLNTDLGHVIAREFSLLSLYSEGEMLSFLRKNEDSAEQLVLSKIEKLFACLMLVRSNKEAFKRR